MLKKLLLSSMVVVLASALSYSQVVNAVGKHPQKINKERIQKMLDLKVDELKSRTSETTGNQIFDVNDPAAGDTVGKTDYDYDHVAGNPQKIRVSRDYSSVHIVSMEYLDYGGTGEQRVISHWTQDGSGGYVEDAPFGTDVRSGWPTVDIGHTGATAALGEPVFGAHTGNKIAYWTGSEYLQYEATGTAGNAYTSVIATGGNILVGAGADLPFTVFATTDFGSSWSMVDSVSGHANVPFGATHYEWNVTKSLNDMNIMWNGCITNDGEVYALEAGQNADVLFTFTSTDGGTTFTASVEGKDGDPATLVTQPTVTEYVDTVWYYASPSDTVLTPGVVNADVTFDMYYYFDYGAQTDGVITDGGRKHLVAAVLGEGVATTTFGGMDVTHYTSLEKLDHAIFYKEVGDTYWKRISDIQTDTLQGDDQYNWTNTWAEGAAAPSIASDGTGQVLYVAYMGVEVDGSGDIAMGVPLDTPGYMLYYRDIYYTYSGDGGQSWTTAEPIPGLDNPGVYESYQSVDPYLQDNGDGTYTAHLKYNHDYFVGIGDYGFHIPVVYKTHTFAPTVGVNDDVDVVDNYELRQNYPNPFNPTTEISFNLKKSGLVTLKVYDVLGREVATLVNNEMNAGLQKVNFDASNLSSGVYVYTLQAGDFVASKKMMLLK